MLRNAVIKKARNPTRKNNTDRVAKNIQVVNNATTTSCAVAQKQPTIHNKTTNKNKSKTNVRALPTRTTKGITVTPTNQVTKITKSTTKNCTGKIQET